MGNITFAESPPQDIKFADKEYYLVDSLVLENLTQNDVVLLDSCLQIFHLAQTDINKISALDGICENMIYEDWSKYQFLQYKIIENALLNHQQDSVKLILLDFLAGALNDIGYYYKHQGDIPQAIENYQKSLKIREDIGDSEGISITLNNIGVIYKNQGNIPKALEFHQKSLKIQEEIGDKKGLALSLNNMGFIYNDQGDNSKALEYYHKALKIREEIGDRAGIAYTLDNIGVIYKKQAEQSHVPERDSLLKKALEYYNQSLNIREEIGDKRGIAISSIHLGVIYYDQAEQIENLERDSLLNIALGYYINSLKMYEEIGDKEGIASSLIYLGVIMLEKGNLQNAQNYAQRSLSIAREIGYPDKIKNAAKLLSEVYQKENKGMQALEMHKLYITMRDSIKNEETQKATARQQVQYEYDRQKVLDDANNDKLVAIEKQKKEKQQIFSFAMAGGFGLLMVFLLFVFNRLRVTRKQKLVIEEQKNEVEVQKIKVEKQRDIIKGVHKEITDSIVYAKHIQSAILPPPRIVKEYLEDSFILYIPKDVVAGDFYWIRRKDDKILFAAADCTGHGVPGALVSVVCNNALSRSVREYGLTDPGEILDKTRSIVVREFEKSDEEVKDGMDIALCTLEGNKLQYAGAYNPLWILRNGEILETKANRWPIGLTRDPKPYNTHSIDLEKGDVIYIFTDGFVDQFGGEKGKKLKIKGLKRLLLSIYDKPMEEQKTAINEAFFNWMGNLEQVDDVCLIGVRV